MSGKRSVALLCLGVAVSALVASQGNGGYLARLRAHHIKETVLVSAGNRRLAGFFDGLRPDPHWNAKKAAESTRQIPRCGAGRGGLVGKLLSVFESTVHAQSSGCRNDSTCNANWVAITTYSCGDTCTQYTFPQPNSPNYCDGYWVDGSSGCIGTSCSYTCNVSGCYNPNCNAGGGGCADNGFCSRNDQCCSGICDTESGCVNIL
jgi:hypothetical protein